MLIRIAILILLVAFVFLLTKKKDALVRRRMRKISIVIAVILYSVSLMIPAPENWIGSFSTPNAVCRYLGYGEPVLVLEGESSAFCVVDQNDKSLILGMPRNKNGWGIGTVFQLREVRTLSSWGTIEMIHRFDDTDDYYVIVSAAKSGWHQVEDSEGSEFQTIAIENRALHDIDYRYYTYVKGLDDEYTVTVDGVVVEDARGDIM